MSGRGWITAAYARTPADDLVEPLAWLMDNAIPLPGGYRIGLDPTIGQASAERRCKILVNGIASNMIVLAAREASPGLLPQILNQDGSIQLSWDM